MKDSVRPGLSRVALLISVLLLLIGCSSAATPIQPRTSTPTTSQATAPSSTPIIKLPTPSPSPASSGPTINPAPNGELQVHFIDVGQGDSILILAPDGKAMLIDGGEADSGALRYLKSKSINRLDLVVATHPHADHIGGLVQILRRSP